MASKLLRLADLSAAEGLLLAQLAAGALVLGVGLRLLPLRRLARLHLGPFPLFHRRHPIERVALLAGWAAHLSLGQGRCLARSLLLYWLLRARGEAAVLHIGVARKAAGLDAHAWVEHAGRVICDSADMTGRYAPLARI